MAIPSQTAQKGTKPLLIREDTVKSVDVRDTSVGEAPEGYRMASFPGQFEAREVDPRRRPPSAIPE